MGSRIEKVIVSVFLVAPLCLFGQSNTVDTIKINQFSHEITFGLPMFPSLFNNFGIQITKEKIPNPREGTILWLSIKREGQPFFLPINFSYKRAFKRNKKIEIDLTYYQVPTYYSLDKKTTIPYFFLNTGIERKMNKNEDLDINLNYGLIFGYVNSQKYWGIDKLQSYFFGGDIGVSINLPLTKELFIQSNIELAICAVNNKGRGFSNWDANALFSKLLGLNIGYKF